MSSEKEDTLIVKPLEAAETLWEKNQLHGSIGRIIEHLKGAEDRTLSHSWKYTDGVLSAGLLKVGLMSEGKYEGLSQVARMVGVSEALCSKLLQVWERLCEDIFREWIGQTNPIPFMTIVSIAFLPPGEQRKAWDRVLDGVANG